MENIDINDPDLSLVDLIKFHDYHVEVYDNITTEDGYILTAYRIPYRAKENQSNTLKPAVLLIHGLMSNCADFIISGPTRALAFVLNNHGYDVWLGNTRGKKCSRRHTKLNPDRDEQYWKFSFHEMGVYDIPAFLNQITKVTGLQTIAYIGHSQGTILPFVLLSEKPEYCNSFNLIIDLSPTVILPNLTSIPYRILNSTRHVWLTAMEKLGTLEFPPRWVSNGFSTMYNLFGKNDGWFINFVIQFIYWLHGKTPEQLVKEDVPVLLKYFPDATSAIVMKHLGQIFRKGVLEKFDYGSHLNLQRYGTQEPPLYNFNNTTCPVVLFCSSADVVVLPKDARVLSTQLPNCVALHEMENPKFNHGDFLFGKYASEVVYPIVLRHLNYYCQIK